MRDRRGSEVEGEEMLLRFQKSACDSGSIYCNSFYLFTVYFLEYHCAIM